MDNFSQPVNLPPLGAHEIVERAAMSMPHHIAVEIGKARYSYEELNRASNVLARLICEHCGQDVKVVAISVERSFIQIAAVLAAMKAGAACLPIDFTYPPERVRYMLSISGADILLTSNATHRAFADFNISKLMINSIYQAGGVENANLPLISSSEQACYIVFTSGSTGTPKGVMMPHRALVNLATWHRDAKAAPGAFVDGIKAPPITLQFAPLTFDVSFEELFSTWAEGGTVVLVDDVLRLDPEALLVYIREHKVSRLFLPVVAFIQIAEAVSAGSEPPKTLKEVITAGEALVITPAVSALFASLPECELYNEYGPSETHVVTSYRLSGPPNTWPVYPPIGSEISRTHAFVVGVGGSAVADTTEGELWLGGDCLGIGYVGRPDLTSERFIDAVDPHGSSEIIRVYKTGDLVKRDLNGALNFLGRIDQQIKIRGYRIEPAEIETAIRNYAGVENVAVIAHKYESGDTLLVAFVKQRLEQSNFLEKLRRQLKETLPDYMLPAQYRFVTEFPLTPSGKIDRKSLSTLCDELVEAKALDSHSTHSPEEVVAKYWREMLHNPHIDYDDNFFDVGGTSLQVVRLHRKLKEDLHFSFPITVLFEYPTVRGLAKYLNESGKLLHLNDNVVGTSITSAQRSTLDRLRDFRNRR